MLEIKDLIQRFESGTTGEIVKTQTTYLDVVCSFQSAQSLPQEKFRIHFHGKRDFSVGKGKFANLQLFKKHPLLLKYTEPIVHVLLASLVSDRQKFREEINLIASQICGNWRLFESFCSPPSDWTLEKSYGILMEAPLSYAEVVVKAAKRSGVDLLLRNRHEPKGTMPCVLVIDEWYIVADDFRFESVE